MTMQRYDVRIERRLMEAVFEAGGPASELEAACRAAGFAWPEQTHRMARDAQGCNLLRLGAKRIVIRAPLALEEELRAALDSAFAAVPTANCVLVSDMTAIFCVSGPGALDVLRQGAPLDLGLPAFPQGAATGARLWDATAIFERRAAQPHCFDILVDASYAGYVENWLRVAAGEADGDEAPGVMRAPPPAA